MHFALAPSGAAYDADAWYRSYLCALVGDPKITGHGNLRIRTECAMSLPVPVEAQAVEPAALSSATERAKRCFDFVVSACLLVAGLPVMVLTCLLVAATCKGWPVIYWQRRVGYRGRMFHCYKFRTMVTDAETALTRLLEEDADLRGEYERHFKLLKDPRVTRFGRFLRKSSLDELPQLINVLRGDMSLVGPRPLVPDELVHYGPSVPVLLSVRPGITGLWQVSGRNKLPYPERAEVELDYVANHTFLQDLRILGRTVVQMFAPGRNGAY